jgi:1,4-dihydroxy-2-naphthoate octaprenyltransferase
MSRFIKMLKIARFQFAIPCFLIYSAGSLFAVSSGASFIIGRFLLGYGMLFSAQLAIQYSNDYFDYEADKYVSRTIFSGGSGVLNENPELRNAAKLTSVILICISLMLALIFTIIFKFSPVLIVLITITNFVVWFYTAPPLKFAYRGLGELCIIFNAGFILPLIGFFTLKGYLSKELFIFIIPFLIYGFTFGLSVELPDFEADFLAEKRNIISMFGRKPGYLLISIFSILGSLSFFITSRFNLIAGLVNFNYIGFSSLLLIPTSLIWLFIKPEYFGGEKNKAAMFAKFYLLTIVVLLIFVNIYFIILLIL